MATSIVPQTEEFSHEQAMRVYDQAVGNCQASTIIIDMVHAKDATLAAFARLVLLRRALRASGRDLCLINLHDRAASIYHLNRLAALLPQTQD